MTVPDGGGCSPVLQVRGLAKAFGGVEAVRGIDLDLAAGELLALIGPNGAGKTTTFNMLNGQIRPDRGTIHLDGRDITGASPVRLWRAGIGRTFQITATFGSMTVAENLQMVLLSRHRRLLRGWRPAAALYRPQALAVLERVGMTALADRTAGELAYGDLKRLELAIALAGQPRLLLMDEPTAGMAPAERGALMALVADLVRQDRLSVLFTEHDMDVVFRHAHRVMVMDRGERIALGPPATVRADSQVRRVYLGDAGLAPAAVPPPAAPAAAPLLAITDLDAWYGRARILRKVSLSVGQGEAVALLGRNGAGKSTTLRAIMAQVDRRQGDLRFAGHDLGGVAPHDLARLGLGYVPEDRRIFSDLTVLENLAVGRRPPRPGLEPWTPDRLFTLFPNLAELRHRRGDRMSGGEQQMLAVARTLMGNPRLILLDEPSEGLAPRIVDTMAQAIAALTVQGLALLLCEQHPAFAGRLCHRAYLIEQGEIRFHGTMAALAADENLRRTHLAV